MPDASENPIPRPRQVSQALTLLWFSFGLTLPCWALAAERLPEASSAPVVTFNLLMLALVAVLNLRIAQGVNWARWACLGLSTLGIALGAAPGADEPEMGAVEAALNLFDTGITLLALWWLFTGPGAQWFAARRSS
jgi:hypothetical protein